MSGRWWNRGGAACSLEGTEKKEASAVVVSPGRGRLVVVVVSSWVTVLGGLSEVRATRES